MPQLDKISIFTEVFYLFGAFLFLFVYISYFLLPELALLLKIKTSFSQFNDLGLGKTFNKVEEEYTALLTTTVSSFQADLNLGKVIRSELSKKAEEAVAGLTLVELEELKKAAQKSEVSEIEEAANEERALLFQGKNDYFVI